MLRWGRRKGAHAERQPSLPRTSPRNSPETISDGAEYTEAGRIVKRADAIPVANGPLRLRTVPAAAYDFSAVILPPAGAGPRAPTSRPRPRRRLRARPRSPAR